MNIWCSFPFPLSLYYLGILFLKTIGVVFLPVPAVAAHFLDAELSLPAKFCLCLGRVAIACGNIARTTRLDRVWNGNTIGLFKCLDYIKYRITMTCTYVVDGNTIVGNNSLEGSYIFLEHESRSSSRKAQWLRNFSIRTHLGRKEWWQRFTYFLDAPEFDEHERKNLRNKLERKFVNSREG